MLIILIREQGILTRQHPTIVKEKKKANNIINMSVRNRTLDSNYSILSRLVVPVYHHGYLNYLA